MKNEDYIPYREIAEHLDIQPGSILWFAADLTRVVFLALRNEGSFDPGLFIGSFQERLGKKGTLLIPSFNFNLRHQDKYSRLRTLPITGALATAAMEKGDFIRTRNPLHSFLVWGEASNALAALDNQSSFGPGSPFEFLHNYRAKMLIMDTPLSNAFTFVHYVEEMEQVKYRKYKKLNILLEDENRIGEFLFYAKKKGWTMDMNGLEILLSDRQISSVKQINRIDCTMVDLAASFPLIREDILTNRAKNIARFSMKLYFRDVAKSVLARMGIHTPSDKISHDPGLR